MLARATRTVLVLAAAAAIGACGSPSKEFKAVAQADGLEVDLPPPAAVRGDGGAAAGADDGDDLGGGFVPIAFGLATLPAMPISQLLGMTRADIETLLSPVGSDDAEKAAGWVRYSRHLRVRYDGDVSVELTQKVPTGLSCAAAAKWIGFDQAGPAVDDDGQCSWPAGDAARALAEGVFGELDRGGCQFTARAPGLGRGK
jgi:hypothetical protein